MSDVQKKLREYMKRLEEGKEYNYPPNWVPQKAGDILEGVVRELRQVTLYGETRDVAIVKDFKGELWSLWLTPIVLKRLVDEGKLRPGYYICLKFLGKRPGKRWHDYNYVILDEDGKLVAER